jgi:hypothetical protein
MRWPIAWRRLGLFAAAATALVLALPALAVLTHSILNYRATTGVPLGTTLRVYWYDLGGQVNLVWPFGEVEDLGTRFGLIRWSWHLFTPWSGATLLAFALCPLVFSVAPWTRRKYKVRAAHLVRITAYGWVVLCALFQARTILWSTLNTAAPNAWSGSRGVAWLAWKLQEQERFGAVAWFALGLLLSFWWWRAACRHYVKLPHPGITALGLTTTAGLASIVIHALIPGVSARLLLEFGPR